MDHDRSTANKAASGLSKTVGRMNDRTKVILVKATGEGPQKTLDVSIIKATNHNKVPPKEKHIKVLLQYMTWPATGRYINRELVKRAHGIQKWLIVMKCCLTHHRLLRESKGQYARHLTDPAAYTGADGWHRDPSIQNSAVGSQAYPPGPRPTAGFPPGPGNGAMGMGVNPSLPHLVNDASPPLGLSTFRDGSSKKAFDLSTFIRMYSSYLDVVLDVFARGKYLPVGNVEAPKFKELEVDAANELLTQLTRLATCLTACVPLRLAAASELVQVALHFLNFEGRHLFMSLAQMQLAVIEKFFDYSPEVAKKVLAPMEASLKQSEELAKYMRFCQQIIHTSTNAAELKTPCDADFLQAMRDHANGAAVEPPTLDPPVIEMPEPEPEPEPEEEEEEEETEEEEEEEESEPELEPEPEPEPEPLPDLMNLEETPPKEDEEEQPPEEEEDDVLGDLWKAPATGGQQQPGQAGFPGQQFPGQQYPGQPYPGQQFPSNMQTGGANPFMMPPTGQVIPTNTFLAGPTGMGDPAGGGASGLLLPGPQANAQAVTNRGLGQPGAASASNPFAQAMVTGGLDDLSVGALGIIPEKKEPGPQPPMRSLTGAPLQGGMNAGPSGGGGDPAQSGMLAPIGTPQSSMMAPMATPSSNPFPVAAPSAAATGASAASGGTGGQQPAMPNGFQQQPNYAQVPPTGAPGQFMPQQPQFQGSVTGFNNLPPQGQPQQFYGGGYQGHAPNPQFYGGATGPPAYGGGYGMPQQQGYRPPAGPGGFPGQGGPGGPFPGPGGMPGGFPQQGQQFQTSQTGPPQNMGQFQGGQSGWSNAFQ